MKVIALFTGFDLTEGKIYDVDFEYDSVYELKCDTGTYCRNKNFFKLVSPDNKCWCGICDYMLNCPENGNHEKCNLNLAFEESDGELKLNVEKPHELCRSCFCASWQLIYAWGIGYYGCDMSYCYLADEDES